MLSQLLVRVGITGVSTVESGLSRVDRAINQTAKQGDSMALSFDRAKLPLAALLGTAGGLLAQVTGITRAISSGSGIGIAARFQKLEQGFANILGSAMQAKTLLRDLRNIGANTEFNTENLVEFSRVLLATGSTAKGVVREIRALADAAAFAGLSTADVGALSINMSQIRQALRPELEDLKQFGTRGISLDRVVGAAQGKTLGQGQGIRELQKMNGQQAFDTLVQGFEKAFGGSAAKNAGTLLGVVQNLNEAFATAMLPTGKLLVPVLTTAASAIKSVGEGVGRFNEMTGGSAGLIFLIGGLWRAGSLLVGSIGGAVAATRSLTAAIAQYAGVAGAAAASSRISAQFAPGVQAGLGTPQGPSNRIGGPFGIRTAISRAGGLLPMLGGFGKRALGFLGRSGIAGILADVGLNALGDKVGGTGGGVLKGIGSGVGIGSTLGMIVGSIVPGLGTAVGGAVGAAIGGVIGGIKGYFDSKGPKPASDPVAENTKRAADLLKDIHASLIGGGSGLRRMTSEMEIEAAMGRILATGIG